MKKWLILMACVALLGLTALPAMTADAPDGITLDHFKGEPNNLVTTFNHSTHAEYECAECHHKWDGEGTPQSCADAGCHDVMDKKDKTAHSYYLVIHNMRPKELSTCVSCHKEKAGADKEMRKKLAGCKGSVCHP
jgi:cytochrome c553